MFGRKHQDTPLDVVWIDYQTYYAVGWRDGRLVSGVGNTPEAARKDAR